MISKKKRSLKPILESSEGIHLTAYLVNRGDLVDLKYQLQETLNDTSDLCQAVLPIGERRKFFEPLEALLRDASLFKSMAGNIGVFRNKDSFRILSVPVDLERQCYLANSFHVKPLLCWMQLDREFLLLGLTKDSAHLYLGSQTSFQRVDSIFFPEVLEQNELLEDRVRLNETQLRQVIREELCSWMSGWFEKLTHTSTPKLFWAGENSFFEELPNAIKYRDFIHSPVSLHFDEHDVGSVCQMVRKALREEARKALELALWEFRLAEDLNLAKKNIFQISKAAVQGRVKKLLVADGMNVFGKVDRKTGNLSIHPFDLDHEDDDVLDDLAQTVLASGGEVVVMPRAKIPNGRPILAIMGGQGLENEMSEYKENPNPLSY